MIIRFATMEDASTIANNNIMLAEESEGMKISYDETLEGVKRIIENKNLGFYIVAEENGRIAGQLMITYEWSDWRAKQIWWLQSIYVKKEWRKRGVMKKMIEKIFEMAMEKNVALIRLYVHEKNEGAIKAYERAGMKRAPYIIYEESIPRTTNKFK